MKCVDYSCFTLFWWWTHTSELVLVTRWETISLLAQYVKDKDVEKMLQKTASGQAENHTPGRVDLSKMKWLVMDKWKVIDGCTIVQ